MAPVRFLLHPDYFKQVQGLDHVAEFTLHVPALIWEWATYFHLKNAGHKVELVDEMPQDGIVVVSACMYPLLQKPPEKVILISTLADSPPRFFAHVHVSQNPWQHRDYLKPFGYPIWCFINIWPQPGIIPRDSARGDKFERIGFFGHRDQLERSLQTDEFKTALAKQGLTLEIVDHDFNDYTNIDAVIAIRDFTGNPQYHKPNSKLINAWTAGVPVLATNESAFKAMEESPLDFIEVASAEDLLAGLAKLKANPQLVKKMVENGHKRGKNYSQEKILGDWEKLLFQDAQKLYKEWQQKSKMERELFNANLFMARSYRNVKNRIKKKLQFS